jgi:predicted unusual protein kinase regulating ubiquinone biosynthesis (AarF/ABC1/UbiB family)
MPPTRQQERKLGRQRAGQIMGLFYRMLALWLFTERVRMRFTKDPEECARIRKASWTRLGAMYRDHASDMGGLLIKVGQLLSARGDIFPTEFTTALSGLQDTVPGVSYEAIRGVVESEFGKPIHEVYATFDIEPLAAASLGQVHKATLVGGRTVAVKVLRPGVDTLIRADIEGMRQVVRFLLRWTQWARDIDLAGVFYESYHILLRELDLRDEANHTRRFGKMFADYPSITVPEVIDDFTRQRVLTLSFIDGMKVTDREALIAAGIQPTEVARLLVIALAREILKDGFFHADPHPGNLMVLPGPVLVLLDFGMVGQLTPRHRASFTRIGLGILQRDPDLLMQGLDDLEMLRASADRLAVRRAIAWLFEKQLQGDIFELRPEAFLEVARELRQIFYSQAFSFPADIAFLGRGAGTTLGVCRTLDPEGNFIGHVEAAVREYLDPAKEVSTTVRELMGDLAKLPARLDRVLTVIEKGGLAGGADRPAKSAQRWGRGAYLPAFAAVLLLVGTQWWGLAYFGLARVFWTICALSIVLWLYRLLPPSPDEP